MRVWPLLLLSACSFQRASTDFACTVTSDCEGGRICEQGFCIVGEEADAPLPDGPLFTCTDWTPTPQHFEPCSIPLPDGPLVLDMLGEYTYDTSTGTLTDPSASVTTPLNIMVASGRLISVSSLSVGTGVTLRVVGSVAGSVPLIVASWTTIDVIGAIDAGSTLVSAGAGSNPTDCAGHAPTRGGSDLDGGGGSGGGGFRGTGGNGGDGDPSGPAPNGLGGGLVAVAPLLLGGCPGVEGGLGETAIGLGGVGGGAIQLTAQQSITVGGSVNAGGQGGGGAEGNGGNGGSGGGGGGSGGMIGIESPILMIADGAFVTANGGGGGQAGANQDGASGGDGVAAIGRPAGGMVANGGNGIGGLGSGGVQVNGGVGGNDAEDGGGGGGGGAGYIVILSASSTIGTATISPPLP